MSEQQDLIIQPKGGNWNDVQEGLPPVPPGVYMAEIAKWELVDSKAKDAAGQPKGGKNLRFQFRITDQGPAHNRTLFSYIQFAPELNEGALKELMNRAGVTVAPGQGLRPQELVGRTVKLIVEIETYTDPNTKMMTERNKLPRLARD